MCVYNTFLSNSSIMVYSQLLNVNQIMRTLDQVTVSLSTSPHCQETEEEERVIYICISYIKLVLQLW